MTQQKEIDKVVEKVKKLLNDSNFSDALNLLKQNIESGNTDFRLYYLTGTLYLKLNNLDLAETNLKNSIKLNNKFSNSLHNLGIALSLKKNYAEAQLNFEYALNLDPENLETLTELGRNYELNNDFTSAKKYYQIVLKLDNNNKRAESLLGRMLINSGFHKEGLAYLRKSQGFIRFNEKNFEILK